MKALVTVAMGAQSTALVTMAAGGLGCGGSGVEGRWCVAVARRREENGEIERKRNRGEI